MSLRTKFAAAALSAAAVLAAVACSPATASGRSGTIVAVGAENEYANVISQIGGKYVSVTAIESNPALDPHLYTANSHVAQLVAAAQLVVQNGLGYDTYMNKIESGSSSLSRTVIDVQTLLHLPDSTPNPHLWYAPATMPAVAKAIASDLAAIQPGHAAYFQARLRAFDRSLRPWLQALARFKSSYPRTPVAVTEPVGDYMLQAAGASILTPLAFQADVMNGVPPAPQDLSLQASFFTGHKAKVFLYNEQVTSATTRTFLSLAHRYGVPVVGVYETMPVPGYDYQSWMLAEVHALQAAVVSKTSTEKL